VKGLILSQRWLAAAQTYEYIAALENAATNSDMTATATSGTVAAVTAVPGGGVSLTTQASDNAVGTLTQNAKIWTVAQDKPISIGIRAQYAEGNTSAANVLLGLHSATVASALANDGGGTPSSYSGFAFYKVDGGTYWKCESSIGTTKVTTTLDGNNALKVTKTAGGSAYVLFEIDILPKTSTLCDVVYKMDGSVVAKHTDFTFTNCAAMAIVGVVKAGSSTAETLIVSMARGAQCR